MPSNEKIIELCNQFKLDQGFSALGYSKAIHLAGWFIVHISGAFTGTVSIERKYGPGENWVVVDSGTTAQSENYFEPVGAIYRFGFSAFTSGTAHFIVAQGSARQ